MKVNNKILSCILVGCLLVASSCKVTINGEYDANETIDKIGSAAGSLIDKISGAEEPEISGTITGAIVSTAGLDLNKTGLIPSELYPEVDFKKPSVLGTPKSSSTKYLEILKNSSNPNAVIVHSDAVAEKDNYLRSFKHIMNTESCATLVEDGFLTDEAMASIRVSMLELQAKDSELNWLSPLHLKDKNGDTLDVQWHIGRGLHCNETLYFAVNSDLVISGELAYYLAILCSNGLTEFTVQDVINEYLSRLSEPDSCAIYDTSSGDFSYNI